MVAVCLKKKMKAQGLTNLNGGAGLRIVQLKLQRKPTLCEATALLDPM